MEEYAAVAEAYGRYLALVRKEGLMDFSLLRKAADEMLRDRPEVRKEIRARSRHTLVGEYQDTPLHVEILRLVAAPPNEI